MGTARRWHQQAAQGANAVLSDPPDGGGGTRGAGRADVHPHRLQQAAGCQAVAHPALRAPPHLLPWGLPRSPLRYAPLDVPPPFPIRQSLAAMLESHLVAMLKTLVAVMLQHLLTAMLISLTIYTAIQSGRESG